MPALVLIRHAPTDWSAHGRLQGRSDQPLSDVGREMARMWALPKAIVAGAAGVTSPLVRARHTACAMGLTARIEPALIEMDWGDWEGDRLDRLRAADPPGMAVLERQGLDFRPPGGESYRDVADRLAGWVRAQAAHTRPTVGITHKGVITVALALATGWDMTTVRPAKLLPACWHRFEIDPAGRLSVDRLNQPFEDVLT